MKIFSDSVLPWRTSEQLDYSKNNYNRLRTASSRRATSIKPQHRNKRLKKGQLEVLGLTMIVLLLSVGVLFVLKFVILAPKSEIRNSFTVKQVSQNFLAAMAATSTGCQGASISDLIEDCGRTRSEINCVDGGVSKSSCEKAREVMSKIATDTLGSWNFEYRITVEHPGTPKPAWEFLTDPNSEDVVTVDHTSWPKLANVENSRSGQKQVKTHPVSLYPEPGSVTLKLEIFKG